jgi:hypothetical protein
MTVRDQFEDLQYGIVSAQLESLRTEAATERRARALRRVAARTAAARVRSERHFILRLLPSVARRRRQPA